MSTLRSDLRRDIQKDMAHKPDLVFLQIGSNDLCDLSNWMGKIHDITRHYLKYGHDVKHVLVGGILPRHSRN